jgi:hypothetical protein
VVPARADHPPEEPKILLFLGFQLGMPKKDHASEGLSRKAQRLDSAERRGTLVHALLKSLLYPLYSQFFLLLHIGRFRA